MVYVYGDDGGDEKKERVRAIGVVAGLEGWWNEIESQWADRCEGIPFHAKDCESDFNDYAGRAHTANKEMYRDLTTLLAGSKLGGIGVAIDLVAFKKIFPHSLHLKASEKVAYHRAFLEVMSRGAILGENLGEIAKLTFDISSDDMYNAALQYDTMRKAEPELLKWLHPEISFVSAKLSARVQMADLLTYEAWKALDHTVGPVKRQRQSWRTLRATERFETLSYGESWFLDLKNDIESGNLERKAGFNQNDYRKWLEDKGLLHNMSNILRFINWTAKRDEKGK